MHEAFILAAGLGTRLRPLTDHRPKPLVPVCGVPMLAYSLAACRDAGLTDVVVNAHWLADQIVAWEGDHDGVRVTVSTEADLLGTGGGLRLVRDRLARKFLVLNADVIADLDARALLDAVPDGGAAMALRPAKDAAKYGIVAADAAGTVVRLVDVASADAHGPVATDTHFTGLHAMDRAALDLVPEGFQCIIRTAYRALVPQRRVRALRHEGTWLDVGDPALYLAANLAVLRGTVTTPRVPARGTRVLPDGWKGTPYAGRGHVWIGDAQVGRAELEDSIIGDRATIADGARLTRCVVWDGCLVPPGDHEDVIFHDGGALSVRSA
jgi:mannose-1-phosphate guanylyltransferase